jgi:hypothetical protein
MSSLSLLTPQQKAEMCNPNNPKLKFVNSTESKICGIPPTPTNRTLVSSVANNNTTTNETGTGIKTPSHASTALSSTPAIVDQSPMYKQGYAKGVADAKLVQSKFAASANMSPEDVDCDSSIDPNASDKEYCLGYQHGFADTINNQLLK